MRMVYNSFKIFWEIKPAGSSYTDWNSKIITMQKRDGDKRYSGCGPDFLTHLFFPQIDIEG